MAADERSHARLFRAIGEQTAGLPGESVARLEGRHRAGGGNALRAAVLGANDGLVSNASLVMGVAGAELGGQSILITGLAGLMAGSLSMALGEWLSVQSARELYRAPDRDRAGGAAGGARGGGGGAGADLPGQGARPGAGARARAAPRAGPASRPGHPRAGGAGHRSGRVGRIGLGGGDHVVPPLCGGRDHPRPALFLRRRGPPRSSPALC